MASSNSKNMEKMLYAMINCLADNYGFNADEAFEYVRWETDVDHVGEVLKMIGIEVEKKVVETEKKVVETEKKTEEVEETASVAPTESSAGGDVAEKIAACKKNISLWEKKLADGKSKDADKQREKITKEKAKLAKLEMKAGVSAPAPAPAKVEEKKPEEKEKRIKRFSPVMASQLKKALEDVGAEMNDKLKKEFQQYVEELTDDDFRATGLADHMRAFAKLKSPNPAPKTTPEIEELVKEMDALIVDDAPPQNPSNAAGGGPNIVGVSIDELRAIAMTAEIDVPGTYWDADKGRFVKGPESDDDEDVVETKFNNKDYVVGEKTGRVYEVRESGDVFAGFAGVGKFKGLSVA